MFVTILGSGSGGNALLLETEDTRIVVDAGLSFRRLTKRFAQMGRDAPTDIDAVVVTHGHSDHATHTSTYARRWQCPVYATKPTMRALPLHEEVEARPFDAGRSFNVGDIRIRSRSVPHDAPQVALAFETADASIGLVTDLGHIPSGLADFLRGCDTLLLESNHDPDMLHDGPYPFSVKRRVAGSSGHLSNVQAARLLAELRGSVRKVVLMHVSETNNSRQLARNTAQQALADKRIELLVASQHNPMAISAMQPLQLRLQL